MFNAELRFPILSQQYMHWLPQLFPPIEGAFFFDAGVAMNDGSTFAWSRAADVSPLAVRTPLKSVGLSIKINALGFMVLRFDYAKPLNRPGRQPILDDFVRPCILSGMQARLAAFVCHWPSHSSGAAANAFRPPRVTFRPPWPRPPSDAALLRVSRSGGTVQLLHANTLTPQETLISSGLPPITRLLGASSEDKTVYATDNAGRLLAIDLVAPEIPADSDVGAPVQRGARRHHYRRGLRPPPGAVRQSTLTTFKASVDRGTTLLRGPGDQLIAVGAKPGTLRRPGRKLAKGGGSASRMAG